MRTTAILLLALLATTLASVHLVYDGNNRLTHTGHDQNCKAKGLSLPTQADLCNGLSPLFTREYINSLAPVVAQANDIWIPIQGNDWVQIADPNRICKTHVQAHAVIPGWSENQGLINGYPSSVQFPGFCLTVQTTSSSEKFERSHSELSAVYKLLTELEVRLAKQLTAANDLVSQKEAALKSATNDRAAKERDYNTALDKLNAAKKAQEGAQAALNTAQNERNALLDTIRKELALIKKLKEILGAQHCDDLVFEDRCFKVVRADVDFKGALDACNAWGGMPASIENSRQNDFVRSKVQGCGAAWIGGTDQLREGTWKWLDGVAWSYSNWAPGEPNNAGGAENNLEMYDDGRWNDIPASIRGRAHCYVCKKL